MPAKTLAVDVVTASRTWTVPELAATMEQEQLGDLIVKEKGKPIGIVTDRDVAVAVSEHDDLSEVTAADIMSKDVVTLHEDATAVDLPAKMAEGRVRRIPLVDDDGNLTGIATLDDVVATVGEMLEDVATVIEYQSREYDPER